MKSYIATIAIASALTIPVIVVKQSAQAQSTSPQPIAIADAVEAKTGSQEQRSLTCAEQGRSRKLATKAVRVAAVQISPVLYSREGTVEKVVRKIHELHQTSRVGIIGIGGLGHMAVKLAATYGCDVTAFTSSGSKFAEAKNFGANHVVSSRGSAAIKKLAGRFDLLISTVNVPIERDAMIGTLAPNGRLHVVGAVSEPIPVAAISLILGQRSVSGSPAGSPVAIETMLDFASRHNITPQTEHFPMSHINDAFARLESGKARYRIVLDADF